MTKEGLAELSKYRTSPILPGKEKGVVTILPKGLTLIFPSSGSFIEVTTPNAFSTSAIDVVSTISNTP